MVKPLQYHQLRIEFLSLPSYIMSEFLANGDPYVKDFLFLFYLFFIWFLLLFDMRPFI